MTDNPKKKFIIEDSSDEEESILSELDIPVQEINHEKLDNTSSAKIPSSSVPYSNSSSSVPSSNSSSSVPETSSSRPDITSDTDYELEEEFKKILSSKQIFWQKQILSYNLTKHLLKILCHFKHHIVVYYCIMV